MSLFANDSAPMNSKSLLPVHFAILRQFKKTFLSVSPSHSLSHSLTDPISLCLPFIAQKTVFGIFLCSFLYAKFVLLLMCFPTVSHSIGQLVSQTRV